MQRLQKLIVIAAASAGLSGCNALMQTKGEDPVLVKLNELEQRLAAIERVVQNQSLVTLSQQLNDLERQTAELRGTIEELNYEAGETAERQRALYMDLDSRMNQLETSVAQSGSRSVLDGGTLAPGQLPVPGGSDRDNYQAAFELVKEQRYDAAEIAFEQFLVTFPESDNVPNALYWLAESHYVRQQYAEALASFQRVIEEHPSHRKSVDALLKVGYCLYELKRWDAARTALARVQSEYPDTTAARLAGQRLRRMDTEGV